MALTAATAGRHACALATCLTALALPHAVRAQSSPFNDSLFAEVRAVADAIPGDRPLSLHVMKIVESSGPLRNYVAVDDSDAVPSCFPVFQIRYRDRWIVVDAALDSAAIAEFYGAHPPTFHRDRYESLQRALLDANKIVLTHEHLDDAIGVERGPHFYTVAKKTLLTEEQFESLLDPKARGIVRLTRDSLAAFPVVRYDRVYPLAPGVVLIKAAGHTPGSQFVYVQLRGGNEVLIAGDLAWQSEGLWRDQQKPEATSRALAEDREALRPQLAWARRIAQRGEVTVVLSHDSRQLDSLVTRHVLVNGFDLRVR